MAVSRTETQITWAAALYIDIAAGLIAVSDPFTFATDAYEAALSLMADNQGVTPAAGDVVDVYLAWTTGDIAGDTGDDFDTQESHNLTLVKSMDTFLAGLGGASPAGGIVRHTWSDLPVAAKGFKVVAKSKAPVNAIRLFVRAGQVLSGA